MALRDASRWSQLSLVAVFGHLPLLSVEEHCTIIYIRAASLERPYDESVGRLWRLQEVLDFLARKAFTRDAALKYLFNDVLRWAVDRRAFAARSRTARAPPSMWSIRVCGEAPSVAQAALFLAPCCFGAVHRATWHRRSVTLPSQTHAYTPTTCIHTRAGGSSTYTSGPMSRPPARRLMQGQLTTVSHFVPGDFGHERYFLSLRVGARACWHGMA